MILWWTQDGYRVFLYELELIRLQVSRHKLFATKLIPTNVSQNHYSSLDFLSHFKNGIINRVF